MGYDASRFNYKIGQTDIYDKRMFMPDTWICKKIKLVFKEMKKYGYSNHIVDYYWLLQTILLLKHLNCAHVCEKLGGNLPFLFRNIEIRWKKEINDENCQFFNCPMNSSRIPITKAAEIINLLDVYHWIFNLVSFWWRINTFSYLE